MNRWKIPDWLETEVRARHKTCIYCGVRMLDKSLAMPRVNARMVTLGHAWVMRKYYGHLSEEPLTWTPPVCQVSIGENDALDIFIE
jgi:hypothetical protein